MNVCQSIPNQAKFAEQRFVLVGGGDDQLLSHTQKPNDFTVQSQAMTKLPDWIYRLQSNIDLKLAYFCI